jgi:hypothetical protein
MPWLLSIELSVVWVLWALAAAAEHAIDRATTNRAIGVGGVSIFPTIPLFPIFFLGLALAIDSVAQPWGTFVIAGSHAVLGIAFVVLLLKSIWRLQS